jgi:MoxR-like ATPase
MSGLIDQAIRQIEGVLKGKVEQIQLALACLIAEGHLLIEDLPGMGKTTLAEAIARISGLSYARVQFTSDMLPADIIGATVFEKESGTFRFHRGPIFTQVLLADEINRTTPKTQSALLEAMAERQVSVEGETYPLPESFFVIATQNPSAHFGTFPLPESQLDRFLLRIEIGYPDHKAERALLRGEAGREKLQALPVILPAEKLRQLQLLARKLTVSEPLLDYVQRLIEYTRDHRGLQYGISPRGGLALLAAARAWAMIQHREYVVPEDIQAVLVPVFLHRLVHAADSPAEASAILDRMRQDVAVS